MKTRIVLVAVLILSVITSAVSQRTVKTFASKEVRLEAAKNNVMVGLRSENNGVVEAAIMFTAKLKMIEPESDISKLQSALDHISISHPSPAIRYKASIASHICSDPNWFMYNNRLVTSETDQFFPIAAERLQQKMFGLNTL